MAKMRVYELANSLGIEVERAIRLLQQVGASPRNHMSVVERVPARRVRQLLKQNKNAALPETQLQQVEPVIVAPPPGEAVAETDGARRYIRGEKAGLISRAGAAGQDAGKDDAQAPGERRKRHRQLRGPPPCASPRLWRAAAQVDRICRGSAEGDTSSLFRAGNKARRERLRGAGKVCSIAAACGRRQR